eukprot:1328744-Rhodomonas_salina.1
MVGMGARRYQLQVSHNLVAATLNTLQTVFAAKETVFLLSGMHSLNHMGVLRGIWWGGCHKSHVPTCAVRAIIAPDGHNFPEVLTFLANALTKQEKNVPLDPPRRLDPVLDSRIDGGMLRPSACVLHAVASGRLTAAGASVEQLVGAYMAQLRGEPTDTLFAVTPSLASAAAASSSAHQNPRAPAASGASKALL